MGIKHVVRIHSAASLQKCRDLALWLVVALVVRPEKQSDRGKGWHEKESEAWEDAAAACIGWP